MSQPKRKQGETTMTDNITNAERTSEGWLIADRQRVNNDPWVLDDSWHRGAYTIYTLRGTSIREEERTDDGIGDLFTRFMTRIADAGYIGNIEFIGTGVAYRVLHSTESYSKEWLENRKREMELEVSSYCPEDDYD